MASYTLPPALPFQQVFEFHATSNPDHPLFRYHSATEGEGHITWYQAVKLFDTTAQKVRSRLGGGISVDRSPPPIVGILAATGSVLYASLVFGTLRAGCAVFPLSPRNSDKAIAHLIVQSGVKYLLVSQDSHMQNLARQANAMLLSKDVHIDIVPIPTYEEISVSDHTQLEALPPLQAIEDDRVLIIAHSSGSTSFPKVVPLTQKFFNRLGGLQLVDLSSRVQSTHGNAMFHVMGLFRIVHAAYCGMVLSVFPPTTHALMATPELVLESALATKSTTMLCPPFFLEHWARDPAKIEKLKKFSSVVYGGGPLAHPVGDALERNGVALMTGYGSTEVGLMSQMLQVPHIEGWQYFQFSASTQPVLVPVDGDGTGLLFRLIIKQCATNHVVLPNMEIDGVPAFDTKDLVQRHPTNPALYMIYGRVDDQIMHSNGEKTNPGPIEQILKQDPLIKAAIMFGRERTHAGVLIAPSEEVQAVKSFREAIWSTVEQANAFAPSHSRIFKEMIVVETPSLPFQLTEKGTPRRQAILEDYAQKIETAYAAFGSIEELSTVHQARGDISRHEALEIVGGRVRANLRPGVSENENLFEAGVDSLLAARIGREIMNMLSGRLPEAVVQAVPNDIVFTSTTIENLASFIYGLATSAAALSQTSDPGTSYAKAPVSILDSRDDTIVRLREPAAGEPPLILVHGGGGVIYSFAYMQTHFHTGLWAIQVTSETPRTSFVAQTDFYYHKIKEAQQTGPYRIGGYSAGGLIACRIAKLLESDGSEVIQLAIIDSSPFISLAPRADGEYTPETDFSDPQVLRAHYERALRGLWVLMREDTDPWWEKFAHCAWERLSGRMHAEEMSELMQAVYENIVIDAPLAFEFVLSLAGERRMYAEVVRGIIAWMREVRAPVTLYRASRGLLACVAPEAQKGWWALGLDWCCADMRVVEVDGSHSETLLRDEVIEDLQRPRG